MNIITEDMRWDFDRIEEDFMKHCYDKLRDFAKVQWYEQNSSRFSSPEESHRYMVMGLILNGAKAENEYCKDCFATCLRPITSYPPGKDKEGVRSRGRGRHPVYGVSGWLI